MKLRTNPYFRVLTASLAITLSQAAMATDILWSGATTGTLDWNTGSNWTGGSFTNSTADRADLRVDWTLAPTINLSAPVTVNGILFNDTGASGDTTLTIGNGGTPANTLTLGGSTPSIDVLSTTLTISANLVGNSGFTKNSAGVLALSVANTGFSGPVMVTGGTLRLSNASALNSGSVVQLNSGTTLGLVNSNTIAGLNDNAGSGGSVINTSGSTKNLTIAGSASYSFSGNFTGDTTSPTTLANTRVGLLVSGNATQALGGSNLTTTGYQSVTGGGTLVFAKQNSIFQGLAAGAVVNGGALGTAANAGIAVVNGTVALGVGDSASGYFDSAAIGTFLDVSHMGASTSSTGFRNNSIFGFDTTNATSGTFTYSTALANIGTSTGIGFAKLGAGTLISDAANTYTGVTQVRAGTLQIGAGSTTGALASTADIAVSSGAILAFNRSDATLSQSNKITGAGAVSQIGAGTTTLTSTTSDYSGGTSISAGQLGANSLGSGAAALSGTAARLTLTRSATYSNAITISGGTGTSGLGLIDTGTGINATLGGPITISASPTDAGSGHFGSSGTGSITITGAITSSVPVSVRRNTVIFSGGGSYADLQVRAGTAKLGATNGLATNASVALGSFGTSTLDLNGYNQSLVGLTKGANGATITNSGSNDSLLTTTGTSSFGGDIQDGAKKVTLTVNGGQLTLTGTSNTYTGPTTVTAGKLIVNGSISTSVTTVNIGGTLGGTGTVGAAVTVDSGAFLSPGNSSGNLTLNNGLTLPGTYAWELGALSTSNPGTDYDILTITAGNANITGAALGLNLGGFAPSADPFWTTSQTWSGILNNTGAGSLTGSFAAIDNSSWSSFGTFSTSNVGNDVNLVWSAVPEPNAAVLVGGLGMLALLRRRRA